MNNTLKIVLGIIGIVFAIKMAVAVGSMVASAAIFLAVTYVGYRVVTNMMAKK